MVTMSYSRCFPLCNILRQEAGNEFDKKPIPENFVHEMRYSKQAKRHSVFNDIVGGLYFYRCRRTISTFSPCAFPESWDPREYEIRISSTNPRKPLKEPPRHPRGQQIQ